MKDLSDVAVALRLALNDLEEEFAKPNLSALALEDFKVVIDDVRTSVLAILTAGDPAEYKSFVRKFRLRRAAQTCQAVLAGLVDGTITSDTPGLAAFQDIVDETLGGLNRLSAAEV